MHGVARRRILRGSLLAAALLTLVVWFVWPAHIAQRVELWLHGEQPIQFYLQLDGALLDDYSRVFDVAHNSGDRLATTREALEHGADVIEIDVVSVGGELYAAHTTPPWFVRRGIYQGPSLESTWAAASEARVVKLDLKETSPRYIGLVIAFLNWHDDREVIVMTPDRPTLAALQERAPHVYRFLSVGTQAQLDALYGDPELIALLDGVGIQEQLVTAEWVVWLQQHKMTVLAWTVNGIGRLNELVKLGVDGIITDNLAIMELLGGQDGDEPLLSRTVSQRMLNPSREPSSE